MTHWNVLPTELCLTIQSYLQQKDLQQLRAVNKSAFLNVEATITHHKACLQFGSRWFQEHYKCYWCYLQIPVHHDLCKQFQCCEDCFDSVVKTCYHCKRFPVSIVEMQACEQCEHFWCNSCMYQMCRLYDKSDNCELLLRVCMNCLMQKHWLSVCNNDACDQLLCACRACASERCHSDSCFCQFCSAECAGSCNCVGSSDDTDGYDSIFSSTED